ncbi:hypothetical protein [Senegalia massiliensis]|jgi:uncharacterized membrane protein SirB2|uniref:hypothetical protein n=1 Tax=Senegalia massiliensis TaxID=1720316 RepID=UPI0013EEF575|nr:hypothetical protein [Senegalia massiliensis]
MNSINDSVLLFMGIIFAIIGYYFRLNENLNWLTDLLCIIAVISFIIQAILIIKK